MKGWLERSDNSILLVALLAGAILRWLQISSHSFWYDEALTSLIASLSLSEIVANAAATDHPPAYYLLLHFWLQFGRSDLFIRSLSALFSLATIPLMYGLGRWLFDRTTGTVAALATAILPFQIYFAQETRMYGLAIFIAAALTWLFLRAVLANAGWRIWLGYALIATVGLYTHYFTAFLLLGLHLWWLLNFREYRSVSWRLALADGLIALLFLPQLGQALGRTSAYLGGVAWQATPHILSPLTTLYYLLFAHRTPIWLFPITLFLTPDPAHFDLVGSASSLGQGTKAGAGLMAQSGHAHRDCNRPLLAGPTYLSGALFCRLLPGPDLAAGPRRQRRPALVPDALSGGGFRPGHCRQPRAKFNDRRPGQTAGAAGDASDSIRICDRRCQPAPPRRLLYARHLVCAGGASIVGRCARCGLDRGRHPSTVWRGGGGLVQCGCRGRPAVADRAARLYRPSATGDP